MQNKIQLQIKNPQTGVVRWTLTLAKSQNTWEIGELPGTSLFQNPLAVGETPGQALDKFLAIEENLLNSL